MIELPPDSLGPVPTKKQMETLVKMATANATVRTWSGIRSNGGAYIDYHAPNKHVTEKVNQGTVEKFYDYGWLEHIDGDFRGHNYRVSERALKVIKLGKVR